MSAEAREIPEQQRPDGALRDGIGEEDNPIPAWWWWSFIATVLFASFYLPYYLLSGWSAAGQYAAQVAAAQAQAAAVQAAQPETNPYHGNAAAIAEGKETFTTICAACHKADGSGLVGPSLIDPYWKYGHSDADLFTTVSKGRPGGMPAWLPQLGADKIWKVLAYVETLPKTDKPGLGSPSVGGGGSGPPAGAATPAAPPGG
jgi:cytochrome c oxidase cbb3-type subunit 3